jgi:hypothetical protein
MTEKIKKWESIRIIETGSIIKKKIRNTDIELKTSEVFELLSTSESFRTFFTSTLISNSFGAFFWEVPPISITSLGHPFEFVQTNAPPLMGVLPDPNPFSNQFKAVNLPMVLSFENLGGDALLIVPAPISKEACYGHLASFLRGAPINQVHSFWKTAAELVFTKISTSPIWLSTAGLGVSWLHLRIDSRPKYFRYEPYKHPDFESKT